MESQAWDETVRLEITEWVYVKHLPIRSVGPAGDRDRRHHERIDYSTVCSTIFAPSLA
jgi:hypothetical protein